MAPEQVKKRLQKIHALEQKIILILHTAADAISYLEQGKTSKSNASEQQWRAKFEASTKQYYDLLEEVSVELRREVRLLRQMTRESVLPVQIPPKAVWQEGVKEKEIWNQLNRLLDNVDTTDKVEQNQDNDVEMS